MEVSANDHAGSCPSCTRTAGPFGSPARQLDIFLDLCRGLEVGEEQMHRMLYANAQALFTSRVAADA